MITVPNVNDLKEIRGSLLSLGDVRHASVEFRDEVEVWKEDAFINNECPPLRVLKPGEFGVRVCLVGSVESADTADQLISDKFRGISLFKDILFMVIPEWENLTKGIKARDILDLSLRSGDLSEVASGPHEAWRKIKGEARNDPDNPYKGWGPQRVKVKSLDESERQSLQIRPDANPDADVFHPLDAPLDDLDQAARVRNIVPVASMLNVMADTLLPEEAEVDDLVILTEDIAEGRKPAERTVVNAAIHIGWMAADLALGGSPDATPENYHVFNRLSPDVQRFDDEVLGALLASFSRRILSPNNLWDRILELKGKKPKYNTGLR